ncbi:DNA-methyltransferase Dcm [Beggiatoa alba B18LD]|uniref:Cytosine-specific methyltransferase n=1 Tax=Beggiatoa alba B18LD TaxID=395493 RepID=I3CCG6_9GAMM|nr:DNA (cytosine-5-)-methyltransferase [Beggiatoa alba]EIJ41309.1 DNA-methyltransferase Dcm [Beggiatoa alba B18LD]
MKSLEIFSGTGGLAKGLEMAGFEHASFVEFNKDACVSLRKNFNPNLVFEGDIADFDLNNLEQVDIVAGGPPCQPFSLAGKHQAHRDKRDMFPYAIRCIEHLQPKAFFFENVKGLLRASFSNYFEYIILQLTYPNCIIKAAESWETHLNRLKQLTPKTYNGSQYNVTYKLLNAADYGIPQKRERVVIIGIRSDLEKEWKFPESTHSENSLNWEKYVTGEYWKKHGLPAQHNERIAKILIKKYGIFPPQDAPWQTVRDALMNIPHPNEQHFIPDHIFKDGARVYLGHTGSEINQPSKTIKAGDHGVPGGENMICYEDGSVRYFTTYEAKLIQTFPKNFIITGSWGETMRQIGNAVPVKLAEIIGKQLITTLQAKQVNKLYRRTANSYAFATR